MHDYHKSTILNNEENEVMRHLHEAQKIFNELSANDPQNPYDSYNFEHYIDAAKNAVILRGARRLDPEHLLPKKTHHEVKAYQILQGVGLEMKREGNQ